jgi:hypothetical protein
MTIGIRGRRQSNIYVGRFRIGRLRKMAEVSPAAFQNHNPLVLCDLRAAFGSSSLYVIVKSFPVALSR